MKEGFKGFIYEPKKGGEFKSFYIHLMVYILVNLMLFLINVISDSSYLWFLYPLGGWGIGVAIHGLITLSLGEFGKGWKERKIKEYVEKGK